MYISILLPSIFALWAIWKKKVLFSAGFAAWVMGILITYFGGYYAFIALSTTFVLTILSDKLKEKEKDETRDIYQIFSNIFVATISIVLYGLTNDNIFNIIYYAVLTSSLADTLASSIGTLSKREPINIFTLRRALPGESGAITFLGISASILGGLILGLIYYSQTYDVTSYLIIIIMGLVGSLVDSVLGATIQGKYVCKKCKKQVEEIFHCNYPTKIIKGYTFVNNDMVNLLNNFIVFLFTYLILI